MRFIGVSEQSYTRLLIRNEEHILKDIRPTFRTKVLSPIPYAIRGNEQLDLIAVRVRGPGNEYRWFEIADVNADRVIGWKGDFTYIRELNIQR